jgi:hypothetical protein
MRQPSKTSLFAAAKSWDEAPVAATLARAPELVSASDPKGRTALHLACGVTPGSTQLAESHGLKTVATLLGAGCDLEGEVPMEEDEGDFRATPLWGNSSIADFKGRDAVDIALARRLPEQLINRLEGLRQTSPR